jgi:hypothetical protein
MNMKKWHWMSAVGVAALGVVGVAYAATLNPSQIGASCPAGSTGNYHFVNNQTGGAQTAGQIAAQWSSGDSCTSTAYSVLNNTQHFRCFAAGALTSASTNLPGRLVLSDFTCSDVKPPCEGDKCEPPPCDPKTQVCK